jgi:hypothetical protein
MSRANYSRELKTAMTYPLAASLTEGMFAGIVATKYFNAGPALNAVLVAAPMFGSIMAVYWTSLAAGRRLVPFINNLQLVLISCVALIATTRLIPDEHRTLAGWVFALFIVASRLVASGIISLRGVTWRFNYPGKARGQIVSRITVVTTTVLTLGALIAGAFLDRYPGLYVYIYLGGAALGGLGVYQFSKIRVRGERLHLQKTPVKPRAGLATTLLNAFADSRQILREDATFRAYQRWQFFQGFSFMMAQPLMNWIVSRELTDATRDYALATLLLVVIPQFTMVVFSQVWAPLFDRVSIFRFRALQSVAALTAHIVLATSMILGSLWLFAVAGVLLGVSNAGGNLAWNLGQSAFAGKDRIANYQGVHVMLTGVRGCLAPFVATLLLYPFMGKWVFIVITCCCGIATVGYWRMYRAEKLSV